MPSPICEVKEGSGSYGPTTDGVDVTPGSAITIRLADPNVDQWELRCITTDEENDAATINAGLTVNQLTKTATFTAPAAGGVLRFRSRIQNGVDANGVSKPSYSTTFCIYTVLHDTRLVAADETTEGGSFGWVSLLNKLGRKAASREQTVGPEGSGSSFVVDGTADDVQINAAIAAVYAAGGGVVRLLPGSYYCDAQINLMSGVVVEGSGRYNTTLIAATAFPQSSDWLIGAAGSLPTGTAMNLAANAVQGDTTITGTAGAEYTAIAVESYVYLTSDAVWETNNLSGRTVGEFVQVVSKSSPSLTIYGMVRDEYNTADTARIYRVQFVESCGIRNLAITQQAALDSRTGYVPPMVGFQLCRDAFIEGCKIYNSDGPAIADFHSIRTRVIGNSVHDLTSNAGANRYGYGTLVGGASEGTTVSGNNYGRTRHAVDAGPPPAHDNLTLIASSGIPRGVAVTGNTSVRSANVPYSTHCEADGWSFSGNTAECSESIGFYIRGRNMSITGNTVRWCSGGIQIGNTGAFDANGGSGAGSHVVGNTISHCKSITPGSTGTNFGGRGIVLSTTDHVTVSGNTISNCDSYGIYLRQFTKHCTISQNTIKDVNLADTASSAAIQFEVNTSGTTATLTYSSGTVTATGLAGVVSPAVGKTITISNAATSANNGTFTIVSVVSATSVTWANASGATDANNGSIRWNIECSTDNVFSDNRAINSSAASDYDRDTAGHAKYLVSDGEALGNTRNTYIRNYGSGMETDLFLLGGTVYELVDNSNASYARSGTQKIDVRKYTIPVTVTTDGTPTALLTIETAAGRNYYVSGHVQGINSGSGYWLYTIKGFYQNNSGTLTSRLASPVTSDVESSASADLTANVSGETIPITATGIAGTISWTGQVTVSEVHL